MRFGKIIENNLIESLRKAGFCIVTNGSLDHNYKCDFLMEVKHLGMVGVQISLIKSNYKAAVAKACAIEIVHKFVYLSISPRFFSKIDAGNGRILYNFLARTVKQSRQNSLMIDIQENGYWVREIEAKPDRTLLQKDSYSYSRQESNDKQTASGQFVSRGV